MAIAGLFQNGQCGMESAGVGAVRDVLTGGPVVDAVLATTA